MNIPVELKTWIDNASYEEMLYRWRYMSTEENSPWFQGDVGQYYAEVMMRKRDADHYGAVLASRRVGWKK